MQNQPSNPISVNQIVDTNLDLKCITPPDCRTLPNDVQALIDSVCKNQYDKNKIIKACLSNVGSDVNDMINRIISYLCTLPTTSTTTTVPFITGFNFCDSDGWTVSTVSNCLIPTDSCNNPVTDITELDILRAIVKRIVSLELELKRINAVNVAQQIQISTNITDIQNIILNCCNVSVVSMIQSIQSRLTAGGL